MVERLSTMSILRFFTLLLDEPSNEQPNWGLTRADQGLAAVRFTDPYDG